MYERTEITAPTVEPISLDEAKAQLNLTDDFTDDDTLLINLIKAARFHVENTLNRALITQTWDIFLDEFEEVIKLPKSPLQSITSIKYIDVDGNEQTLSSSVYTVDTASNVGRVYLAYNQSWPSVRAIPHSITIRAVVGYGYQSAIPEPIKQAMKILISDMYIDRESYVVGVSVAILPPVQKMLLAPYMVSKL